MEFEKYKCQSTRPRITKIIWRTESRFNILDIKNFNKWIKKDIDTGKTNRTMEYKDPRNWHIHISQ